MNSYSFILPAVAVVLASCENGGRFSSGGFDPLDAAGGGSNSPQVVSTGYKPGAFVKTSMHNAAFFKQRPKGNADADKLLPANTTMKVISSDDNYLKVELDSGEVGFIPAVMVIDQDGSAADPYGNSAVQVWPLPNGVDPNAVPAGPDSPTIPTVIDPDAPDPTPPPLPDDAPTPGLGAEPAVPSIPVEEPEVPEVPAE